MAFRNEISDNSRSSDSSGSPLLLPQQIEPLQGGRQIEQKQQQEELDEPRLESFEKFVLGSAIQPVPLGPPEALRIVDMVPLHETFDFRDRDVVRSVLHTFSRDDQLALPDAWDFGNARICNSKLDSNSLAPKNMKVESYKKSANTEKGRDSQDDDSNASPTLQFRASQTEQWNNRYNELVAFQKKHGHCHVPHNRGTKNNCLAWWVKRQRTQYRLKQEGKRSSMTDEREDALNRLDFVWDPHRATWDERLNELRDYQRHNGHCNVSMTSSAYQQLAVWIKFQRRQYRAFCDGKRSTLTNERIAKLNELGFDWNPKGKMKQAKGTGTTQKIH